MCVLIVMTVLGCSSSPAPAPPSVRAPESTVVTVDPNRVKRVRADLPPGYEVGDALGVASPAELWGFRAGWTAEPAPCAQLVDPAAGAPAQGLSGSGDGGLLYVVVATAQVMAPDPALRTECAQWTMTYGRSSASASVVEAPHIEGVETVGVSADIRTVVESGNETDSRTQTFTAYLGDHYVFVTLIVDPGSPHPPLPSQFAAELLVKTVSALRG